MPLPLTLSAFVAGILTFLAPCTLPMVPGYLSYIGGTSILTLRRGRHAPTLRRRILINGLLYVIGFSSVFIALGALAGFGGSVLSAHRSALGRIGGILVILFGLQMLGVFRLPFTQREFRFRLPKHFTPGRPLSSLVFGSVFAFGWTPCVGPVLGTVLFLASGTTTVLRGIALLGIFSLGLALPFLALALAAGSAMTMVSALTPLLRWAEVIGGFFLVAIGVLMLTNHFSVLTDPASRWFSVVGGDFFLTHL